MSIIDQTSDLQPSTTINILINKFQTLMTTRAFTEEVEHEETDSQDIKWCDSSDTLTLRSCSTSTELQASNIDSATPFYH